MTDVSELASKHCKPCEGGMAPLSPEEAKRLAAGLPGWELQEKVVEKEFSFKNFHETMAFVNAVAWISHRQDHHPDLEVSYRKCRVRYTTHSVGGLSENDFICAACVEALLQ